MEANAKVVQESSAQQQQVDAAMQQQALQTQLQIAQENREDVQVNEKDNIVLKADKQIEIDNNQAKNKMYENQMKNIGEIINSQNVK